MDIHKQTAQEVFPIGGDQTVTEEMMDKARAINFGLLYGRGFNPSKDDLYHEADLDPETVKAVFEEYFYG